MHPELTEQQSAINEELVHRLVVQIESTGPMRFSEYMHRCLYEPGLGYYVNGLSKIGSSGDFITAPDLSTDFADCLAHQCAEILTVTGGDILEFGGGTGRLAVDTLLSLERIGLLPEHYFLLDVSADLKLLQRQTVQRELPAHLSQKVSWVDSFIDGFCGVVVANELFDAFPVEQFEMQDTIAHVRSVDWTGERFVYVSSPDDAISSAVNLLQKRLPGSFPSGFVSEVCPVLGGWWQSLADAIDSGVVLACDYGSDRTSYYAPTRSSGTLRCFFRHGVHSDALINQGVQDITADVDFTALAEAATSAGFSLEGYTTLAQFLMSLGALDQHQTNIGNLGDLDRFKATGKLKQLLLPEEMGERFMVAGFSKNFSPVLQGFAEGDLSRLL